MKKIVRQLSFKTMRKEGILNDVKLYNNADSYCQFKSNDEYNLWSALNILFSRIKDFDKYFVNEIRTSPSNVYNIVNASIPSFSIDLFNKTRNLKNVIYIKKVDKLSNGNSYIMFMSPNIKTILNYHDGNTYTFNPTIVFEYFDNGVETDRSNLEENK